MDCATEGELYSPLLVYFPRYFHKGQFAMVVLSKEGLSEGEEHPARTTPSPFPWPASGVNGSRDGDKSLPPLQVSLSKRLGANRVEPSRENRKRVCFYLFSFQCLEQ